MKQNSILKLALFTIIAFSLQLVSAQFPIKIPKFPKTETPKQEQPKTDDNGNNQTESSPISRSESQKLNSDNIYKNTRPTNVPVLLKNSIYVQARTHNEYWKMPNQSNYSSWVPVIRFNQFYNNDKSLNYTVDFFNPDGSLWFSEKMETGSSNADRTVSFKSSNPYENLKTKSIVGTGVYSFKITNQDAIYKNRAADYDERTTEFAAPFAPQNTWKRWLFQWYNFRFDNNGTFRRENYPNAHYADKNPGEYTVKIYRNGTQIRELSFSIGADGRIVVPGYSNQISLPYHRVILPVKIMGTEKWDSMSWKTDAFYGNPLTGFTLP